MPGKIFCSRLSTALDLSQPSPKSIGAETLI